MNSRPSDAAVDLALAMLRENFRGITSDEGYSVKLLCDELERLRDARSMFAIGSKKWPGLSKLDEEAGEVIQVIGKLMGTYGEVEHWDGTNLRTRLIEEVGDVLAACDFVAIMNDLETEIDIRRKQKLGLFHKWHQAGDKP